MFGKKAILSKIQENAKQITKLGVKRIAIFGSFVKGTHRKDSDIDILVVFEEGKTTFDNYMDLKFFLEDLFKNKIDLVVEDSLKPRLKPYILKEAIYAKGL